MEKCKYHQQIEDYGQPGKGGRPQMFAGFCGSKRYQTGAATDDELQEQAIISARRPEKHCAWQYDERLPFHDFCKHKNPFAGFTHTSRKVGKTGQVRRRNPEELS